MKDSKFLKNQTDSKSDSKNIGSNFHYIFMKELLALIKKHDGELKQFVKGNLDLQVVLGVEKYQLEDQKQIFYELMGKLKGQEWVKKIIRIIEDKLLKKTKQLYEFQTQQNYFLAENFRQTCKTPLSHQKPSELLINVAPLYKVCISKQLRRTLWLKSLCSESNKFQFFKYDHKVVAYNLRQELTIGMTKLWLQNGMKLKQNQKDCCMRLLQFVVKKWDRIPNRFEQSLTLTVMDVFAHFTPSRMSEIGAVYVGLGEISNLYFEPDVQKRMQNLSQAFQLVDPKTYNLISNCYLTNSNSSSQLNQAYQHFRLTLSTAFFPLSASQYIIDQILIKKKNKFDMYILFSLLTMIMSDVLEDYKNAKMELTEIVNAEKTKKEVKLNDVVDAFRVVYEGVGMFHGDGQGKLLQKLRQFDQSHPYHEKSQANQAEIEGSLKLIQPENQMAGFVVESKEGKLLRLGSKS